MDILANRYNSRKEMHKIRLGVAFFCICILAKTQGSFMIWAMGILMVLLFSVALNNFKLRLVLDKKNALLLGAWVIFCTSFIVVSNRSEAIKGIMQMTMFFGIIIYGMILADTYKDDAIEKMFMGICFVIFISSLYGIYEYITLSNPLNKFFYVQKELLNNDNSRAMSIYLHPIYFSQVIIIGFCINYYFNKSYFKRNIYNLVFLFALYTTKTRGAWIIFGVLFVLSILSKSRNRQKLIKKSNLLFSAIFISVLVAVNLKFDILASVFERFGQLKGGASMGQRTEAVNYILNQFLHSSWIRKLIGHGVLGTSHQLSKVTFYYNDFVATDNQWVSWLYNNGLIFVAFIIAFTIYAIYLYVKTKDNIVRFMVTIYLAYLGLSFFVEIGSAFAGNLFLYIPIGYLLRQNIKERSLS